MAEIERLSLADVRYLASQLRHKTGLGLPALLEKHPWIKDYSQETVREIYGDRFRVWRYLTVTEGKEIRPEGVVPTTGNPAWALYEIAVAPQAYWKGPVFASEFVELEHAMLRYEITPERVLVYVPAIIHIAMDTFGETLRKWKSIPGMSLNKVFTRILYENQEEEIVADVSGLTPEIMDFRVRGNRQWWWDKSLVQDVVRERAPSPEEFAEDLMQSGRVKVNDKWPRERIIQEFRDIYRQIQEFFAP